MEYLMVLVISSSIKFATSVLSNDVPQAPVPIPKGKKRLKKQNKTKTFTYCLDTGKYGYFDTATGYITFYCVYMLLYFPASELSCQLCKYEVV